MSLRGAVAELRRSLGEADDALVASRERIGLRRGPLVCIDAVEFEDRVRAGRWEAALELARGQTRPPARTFSTLASSHRYG